MKHSHQKQLSQRVRAAAEARLAEMPATDPAARPVENLLHELQVHQIELEMQNESLRLAQLSLENARDRYQDLYETAPVGYLTIATDGQISELNLAAAEMLGVARHQALRRHFASFVEPDDQDRWIGCLASLGDNQPPDGLELSIRRHDDTALYVQVSWSSWDPVPKGKPIRITLTDITSRKLAEHESRHSLYRIESLMRHASDCIVMFDAETRIIEVSDSCLERYGYSRESLLRMRLAELCAPAERAAIPDLLKELAGATSLSYQSWHCRADGSEFPVQIGATMIDIDGCRYYQVIARDIAETFRQKAVMESGLAAASQRLLELSRHLVEAQEDARRRLSRELHDHTSPNLAAMKINLGLLANRLPAGMPKDFKERLADTIALAEDTEISVRDIGADLRSSVLDYAGVATAMEEYAKRYASRTGIAVTVNCKNKDARLAPAIESLIFRIFQEALTNSLKHARARSIQVDATLDAQPIALTITDDGIGFDVGATDTDKRGMGLLNMREMAEFAGGQFDVASRPGEGTRVSVCINP